MRLQLKKKSGELLYANFKQNDFFDVDKKTDFENKAGTLTVFADKEDLIGNAKVFRKVAETSASFFLELFSYFRTQITAQSHALKKIQPQMQQKIEGLIESPMFTRAQNYLEQKQAVLQKVKQNPEKTAEVLVYLQKRISEIGAHITSFEIMHMGSELELSPERHNIRRVILNALYAFKDRADEYGLQFKFYFDDAVAEENKLRVDYGILIAGLYNFFDNAIKYSMSHSEIHLDFDLREDRRFELVISMDSLKIDPDEIETIFELGVRGRNASAIDGSGVGMYVFKRSCNLNRIDVRLEPDYEKTWTGSDETFVRNKFVLSGKV